MNEPVRFETPDKKACTWKLSRRLFRLSLENAWLVDTIPAINIVYAVKRPRIPKQRYLTHSFNHTVKENCRNKKTKIQNIAWRTPMTSIVNLICQSNWGFSFQNPSPDLWVMPVVLKTIKRHVFIMSRSSFICVLKSGIRAGVACWCSGWELGPPSKEVLDLISDAGTFCEGLEIWICLSGKWVTLNCPWVWMRVLVSIWQ